MVDIGVEEEIIRKKNITGKITNDI